MESERVAVPSTSTCLRRSEWVPGLEAEIRCRYDWGLSVVPAPFTNPTDVNIDPLGGRCRISKPALFCSEVVDQVSTIESDPLVAASRLDSSTGRAPLFETRAPQSWLGSCGGAPMEVEVPPWTSEI